MGKERWALLSFFINFTLSLLKLLGAKVTGSLSLTAEALHSLSDSFASLLAYLSIKFSEKKNERFPYGLYKLENLGAILIGIFLVLAGVEIAKRSFERRVEVGNLKVGILIITVSLLASLTLSFLERRAGKRLNSPTLVADSYHTLSDALGSLLVLISFLFNSFGHNYDGFFALGVSFLILHTAFKLLKEQVGVILDISADEEVINKIRRIILSYPEVVEIKSLLVRSAGGKYFLDAVLVLNSQSFERGHRLVDEMEKRLLEEVENLNMAIIHYEPIKRPFKIGVMVEEGRKIAKSFEEAKEVLIHQRGKRPKLLPLKGKEEGVAKTLAKLNLDLVIVREYPNSPKAKYILHQNSVFLWKTEEENPYKALSEVCSLLKDRG